MHVKIATEVIGGFSNENDTEIQIVYGDIYFFVIFSNLLEDSSVRRNYLALKENIFHDSKYQTILSFEVIPSTVRIFRTLNEMSHFFRGMNSFSM